MASTVSRPSVTPTVTVPVAYSAAALETKWSTAVAPSTRITCTLLYVGWSPTDTVTVYRPAGTAYSQAPGVASPLVNGGGESPYCMGMNVFSRGSIPVRARSRGLRGRARGTWGAEVTLALRVHAEPRGGCKGGAGSAGVLG